MRNIFVVLFIALVAGTIIWVVYNETKPVFLSHTEVRAKPLYEGTGSIQSRVSVFAQDVGQVTQLEITPDSQYLLVGTLQGTVWIYHKVHGVFLKQEKPFYVVDTAQPGFPPREAGLTGIVLGADFATSGDVFLTYSYAAGKKEYKNRVSRVTFTKQKKVFSDDVVIVGKEPLLIFEANTPGAPSHQIQDGIGLPIADKPHLLFSIGEGFQAKRALNPSLEAGKLVLIQRDGSIAHGKRPFPEDPKVQTIGIRNAPTIASSSKFNKIALADTGPERFDRFIYGTLVDQMGENTKQQSFNWNGKEESLALAAVDVYNPASDSILYRWNPTETAVGIAFYENTSLPKLFDNQEYVLVELFGKTNFTSNTPGKKILLGTITNGLTNSISFEDLVIRKKEGEGKLAHPLGLAVDPQTKIIYFGDLMEGRIYTVTIGGDTHE